ncbi:MAG: hypothetical protein H7Y20_11175 [Bryobacteraceae bacterium]|nr:hypothetical protein [Bryobacteraceae bacterium]
MKKAFWPCLFVLSGCGRYSDFTLPRIEPKSGPVRWEWQVRPEPVIVSGAKGAWDGVDALNPSVVRFRDQWWNLYSGFDGRSWHTGLAVSTDGAAWERRGKVLSPDPRIWEGDYIAANGSALVVDGKLFYWYQGGRIPRIGLATSSDGLQWTKESQPVLSPGPRGSWDEMGVADPYVIRLGSTYYMYFLGQDRARRQRLGVARSSDGLAWERQLSNPILGIGEAGQFDETGLGEPAIWAQEGSYWMLYTARDRKEYRRLGLARSQDGVRWTRVSTQAVFSGTEAWNSAVVCDPSVEVTPDGVKVWFGGGNRPEPAENLNGQIGYGVLRLGIGGSR